MKVSRRDFIHAGCIAGAVSLAPHFLDVAEARFPRGAVSDFNGGKIQAQDYFLLQSGTYPFINMMKNMQAWTYNGGALNGYPPIPTELDVDGYLTTTATGGVSNVTFIPPSKTGIGTTWVMTWSGRGTVFVGGATVTSGAFSNIGLGATGRCEFWLPVTEDGQFSVGISAVTSSVDYPHDMKFFLLSEETSLNSGNILSTQFKSIFGNNVGVWRTLDWQLTNAGLTTTWESRKSLNHYSYYADEYRAFDKDLARAGMSMYGTTTGTGTAYAATIGTGGPVNRRIVIVTWNTNQTGAATFDLNGTGAVPMVDVEFMQRIPNGNLAAATLTSTLVYDADLNVWIKYGGNPGQSAGIKNGVPPEIILRTCIELRAHPYILVPFMAADPVSNFVTEFDDLIKTTGPAWMIPRWEPPNEAWNNSRNFFAYDYIFLKNTAQWGTTNDGNAYWYGRTASEIAQAVSVGRANDRTKYQSLCGVQSALYPVAASTTNPRLNSPRGRGFKVATFTAGSPNVSVPGNTYAVNDPVAIVAVSSADNYPTGTGIVTAPQQTFYVKTTGSTITLSLTPGGAAITFGIVDQTVFNLTPATTSPAYHWVTTVCCTGYSNPNAQNQLSEIKDGFAYLTTGSGSLITNYQTPNTISDDTLKTAYAAWYAWANSFGPAMKLCQYEGGWSPDYIPWAKNWFNPITAIAKTTSGNFNTVLTLGNTNYGDDTKTLPGHGFVVGMPLCGFNITTTTQLNNIPVNVGFTIGSPGVVSWGSPHGFPNNQPVTFGAGGLKWGGSFDCPIIPGIVYYIKDNAPGGDNTKFTVSLTSGGAAVAFTTTNTATCSASACWVVTAVTSTTVTINCDSSSFTNFGAGTGNVTYGCYGGDNGGTGSAAMVNIMRIKSKGVAQLATDTLKNYTDFVGGGPLAEFPSVYLFGGQRNVWSVWDPDVYASPVPPQWSGVVAFNS